MHISAYIKLGLCLAFLAPIDMWSVIVSRPVSDVDGASGSVSKIYFTSFAPLHTIFITRLSSDITAEMFLAKHGSFRAQMKM
jgi:hypothetical protein